MDSSKMIGRKLHNRYEVLQHLGDGSTATVFKAHDTRLGREVALKVLLPHVRETTRKRFFQEATAAAQLNHPNIMAIYDIDQEDDLHFLVVEYVEGDTLTHYIPSRPEIVVELGRQIATALNYAHARQIIHRDIKPANIKVTTGGQIKIMDLGLALPKEAKRVTADGMIIGTPAYLSPEQAQGFTLDQRTDIYSLGIVLYEMATGQLPFDSDDIPALLLQQVKQPPTPPRMIVPDLPLGLENVILKALDKNPARRYQTGAALAAALQVAVRVDPAHEESTQLGMTADTFAQETKSDEPEKAPVRASGPLPLRIVLADDHNILRKTLANFLSQHEGFVIVGEAADGDGALKQTIELQPDVLVLDLNMPGKGGLDVLPLLRTQAPKVKVIVLTGRDEDWYIMQALRAGAQGYILKSADEGDLVDGILQASKGSLVLGKGVAEKVVSGLVGGSGSAGGLNEIERKVLLHVAAGFENDGIARALHLSMPMVIEALAGAMDKLGAKDRHGAALQAIRQGHILLEELQELGTPSAG